MIDTNRPVPAAIDGRTWTVSDSPSGGGGTDTRRADMFAPLGSTATERMIRNHELIHARITPRTAAHEAAKKHGVTVDALQWSEDYRVGLLQTRLGLIDSDALTHEEAAQFAKVFAKSPRMMAGALLATYSTLHQRNRLVAAALAGGYDPDDMEELVQAVGEITRLAYPSRRPGRRRPSSARFKPAGFAKHTVPLAQLFDARFPENPPPGGMSEDARQSHKRVQRIRGDAKLWGVVEKIIRLPLVRSVRPRRPLGRRFRDCGVVPSAVHRLPVDMAIFATRQRARGGTILCDASGSMGYDDSDLERIISMAPAATIAFYSGHPSAAGPVGNIVIAAAGGKAATVAETYTALAGGHNYIDGPALRWLAKQDGPRIWVSDQEVGGAGHDYGRGGPCHAECLSICYAANIQIVGSIDEVR